MIGSLLADRSPTRSNLAIVLTVALGVAVVLGVATSGKISFYLDGLERSSVLYALPALSLAGLSVVLAYPRLSLYPLAFLLPFNFVGGYWGSDIVVLLAKVAVSGLVAAAFVATFLAPRAQREWITRSRLGHAVLLWLFTIAMGIAVGLLNASNREYWVRESGWMLFFVAVLPFGTLIRDRRDLRRLLASLVAGVAVLQTYAFWTLVTGTRYARIDAWDAGESFFRAPYSCASLFVLYLAVAALLWGSSARVTTRWSGLILLATVAVLGGGLLASMVRSYWVAACLGLAVVAVLTPWDRQTGRAAAGVAAGAALALAVVIAVDRLSPSTSGNWTAAAMTFLMDLGSQESTSRVTREIEWGHAIDVWKLSPLVGVGFGYSFPQEGILWVPGLTLDAFYSHNSYLNMLAKVGLFGLAALLFLTWQALRTALGLLRTGDAELQDQILATALIAALASVSVLTSVTPVLTAGDSAAYFGMLIGIVVALRRVRNRASNARCTTP